MKKYAFLLFVLFLIFSCKKGKANSDQKNEPIPYTKPNTETLVIGTFPFPDGIDGCSCYYARDEKDFDAEKYIYADNFGKESQMKINEKKEIFELKNQDFDPSAFSYQLENGNYRVEVSGKKISNEDEVIRIRGKITVKDKKTGAKTDTAIYGECGC